MHELSVAEEMLDIILRKAQSEGFKKVQTVWLEVGALSHVESDALAFCFDAVTDGTLVQGADLQINTIAGKGVCPQCRCYCAVENLFDSCPECGGFGIKILQGNAVSIKSLAVH